MKSSSQAPGRSLPRGTGGSDQCDAVPSIRLSRARVDQWRHGYTWNKLAGNGSSPASWKRAFAGRRGSFPAPTMLAGKDEVPASWSTSVSFTCGPKALPHPIDNGVEVFLQHRRRGHQHGVNAIGNTRSRRRGAEPALSPVSGDSPADPAAGNEANPARAAGATRRNHRYPTGSMSNSGPVHPLEIRAAPQCLEGPTATRRDGSVPFDGDA